MLVCYLYLRSVCMSLGKLACFGSIELPTNLRLTMWMTFVRESLSREMYMTPLLLPYPLHDLVTDTFDWQPLRLSKLPIKHRIARLRLPSENATFATADSAHD